MDKFQLKFFFLSSLILIFISSVKASDIIQVSALNSQIIVLHFDDGFVRYHQKGESRQNEWVISEPLNILKASEITNFQIQGKSGFYKQVKNPLKIERKSKGTEFTWLCENYSQVQGCINTSPDHAKEHFIYLHLPEPLEMGQTYVISTGDIAGNGNTWEIEFSLENNRSEAVHVNLVGYDPVAPEKFGYIYHWSGSGGSVDFSSYQNNNFYLINTQTQEKVFTGTVKFRKSKSNKETYQNDTPAQNYLGADVYDCDFSDYKTPGEYILAIDGIGSSFPFKIEKDSYRLAYYTSIRGLYHNRSGIALEKPYTEFTRPAPQNPNISPGFAGKLKYTTSRFVDWNNEDHSESDKAAIEAGILGSVNTWGWYQDAGDWDSYFSHMKIPAMLMLTWEIAQNNFADGELNLPESANGIPDILDEAGWLIHFFQRTRQELMNKGFGTGGIGSRVAPDWYGGSGDGVPSYEDTRQWIISGEDPFTTFFYAGLAAHYKLVLNKSGNTDADSIDWIKEAEEAYIWASNNTKPTDTNPSNVHNLNIEDFRFYAAASLYRLTGEQKYLQEIQQFAEKIGSSTVLSENQKWGTYVLMTNSERTFPDDLVLNKLKGAVISTADEKFASIDQRACRFGGNMYLPMLIGQGTTPRVFELMMGHFISKDFSPSKTESYLSGIYTTADYFLGCNPLNMVYITHVGVRYPERVLHIDSWYREGGDMVPGITPYGPWRSEGSGATGPWDIRWPNKTLFPGGIDNWPGHERWFNNYTTPVNAEFTVHQNTILSAVVYGYLCSTYDGTFNPNDKPNIEISSPVKNSNNKGDVKIDVIVSDPDGEEDIAWVEFYNDWHKIGQSNQAPFSFVWKKPKYGNAVLSAKVVDKRGFSAKSENVQIEITPLNYNVTVIVKDSLTNLPVQNSAVLIENQTIKTDSSGAAFFEQINGLLNISIEKENYYAKKIPQQSIYSDTTLVFYLSQKKSEVVIVVQDKLTGQTFEGVQIIFNSEEQISNENGEVYYRVFKGEYEYLINKLSFFDEAGTVEVNSDTLFYFQLTRANAEIKFVVKEGTTPVNNATVILNEDSLLSTGLGIVRFKDLQLAENYNYKIYKNGFRDITGKIYLTNDTTVNVVMEAIPLGNFSFNKKSNFKMWPNPVQNEVNISSSEKIKTINVSSVLGAKIYSKTSLNSERFKLDLSDLKTGIYFIEVIYSSGLSEIQKLIKD